MQRTFSHRLWANAFYHWFLAARRAGQSHNWNREAKRSAKSDCSKTSDWCAFFAGCLSSTVDGADDFGQITIMPKPELGASWEGFPYNHHHLGRPTGGLYNMPRWSMCPAVPQWIGSQDPDWNIWTHFMHLLVQSQENFHEAKRRKRQKSSSNQSIMIIYIYLIYTILHTNVKYKCVYIYIYYYYYSYYLTVKEYKIHKSTIQHMTYNIQ